jgi:ATP-dependent DNA ligase
VTHPGAPLPPSLRGPVQVMLAQAVETIPGPSAMPGGSLYEPKWDGWRLSAAVGEDRATLWSRRGTDLTARFPEVATAVAAQVPAGTVLDGEVVVWVDDRLDFEQLQRRITTSPASVARVASARPASYVAFDVLAHAGTDLRRRPWLQRRKVLEDLAASWSPPMNLSPVTSDPVVAARWFDELTVAGIEGLVVKGAAQHYEPGKRRWVKVKNRDALDVVCAAVIGPLTRPTALVAGLPLDGELAMVGRTVPLSATASKALGAQLALADPDTHPWPARTTSGAVAGWNASRDPVDLTLVEPVVVEVTADVAWSGRAYRHPLRFLRLRPDLDPADVTAPTL